LHRPPPFQPCGRCTPLYLLYLSVCPPKPSIKRPWANLPQAHMSRCCVQCRPSSGPWMCSQIASVSGPRDGSALVGPTRTQPRRLYAPAGLCSRLPFAPLDSRASHQPWRPFYPPRPALAPIPSWPSATTPLCRQHHPHRQSHLPPRTLSQPASAYLDHYSSMPPENHLGPVSSHPQRGISQPMACPGRHRPTFPSPTKATVASDTLVTTPSELDVLFHATGRSVPAFPVMSLHTCSLQPCWLQFLRNTLVVWSDLCFRCSSTVIPSFLVSGETNM
jgi:hypothetical protein